jgi:hypothetical protein
MLAAPGQRRKLAGACRPYTPAAPGDFIAAVAP